LREAHQIDRNRVDAAVLRGTLALDRERTTARALLDELRTGRRRWSGLSRSEKRLLEGAPLVEYLLDRSFELRYNDPEAMVQFAEAARLVVERIDPRRYGRKVLSDLRARVWAELGNAYRVADDLKAAEAAFGQAVRWLLAGTGSRRVLVRTAELAARLFADQRRLPEAAGLLAWVSSYYANQGNSVELGQTLVSRGLLAEYANEPELAIVYLVRGLRLIGPQNTESGFRLAAVHSLVNNLIEAGHCEAARGLLEKNHRLYHRAGKLNKLRLHWLKGKIAHGLGELGRAEADFHVARLGFKRVEKDYDAALVSLDLALLYARQGKRIATLRLVDEMIGTFRSLGIAREAIASLLLLRRTCEDSGAAPDVLAAQIRTIASLVAELQRHRAGAR
jgi:tetratricopeptide (TPR) repeat protein